MNQKEQATGRSIQADQIANTEGWSDRNDFYSDLLWQWTKKIIKDQNNEIRSIISRKDKWDWL